MLPASERKVVLVTRRTRYEELLARHHTREQAKFYVEHLGADFDDYVAEHETYRAAQAAVLAVLREHGRFQALERRMVPNFLFGPEDVVVALGQDGLVANTMKYLDRHPLIGVNPDPQRWDGVLLPFAPQDVATVLPGVLAGQRALRTVTMARAQLAERPGAACGQRPVRRTSLAYLGALRTRDRAGAGSAVVERCDRRHRPRFDRVDAQHRDRGARGGGDGGGYPARIGVRGSAVGRRRARVRGAGAVSVAFLAGDAAVRARGCGRAARDDFADGRGRRDLQRRDRGGLSRVQRGDARRDRGRGSTSDGWSYDRQEPSGMAPADTPWIRPCRLALGCPCLETVLGSRTGRSMSVIVRRARRRRSRTTAREHDVARRIFGLGRWRCSSRQRVRGSFGWIGRRSRTRMSGVAERHRTAVTRPCIGWSMARGCRVTGRTLGAQRVIAESCTECTIVQRTSRTCSPRSEQDPSRVPIAIASERAGFVSSSSRHESMRGRRDGADGDARGQRRTLR